MRRLLRKTLIIVFVILVFLGLLLFIRYKITDKERAFVTRDPNVTKLVFSNGLRYQSNDNYTGIKISKEYSFDLDDDGLTENLLIKSYEIVTLRKNVFTYYGFVTDVLIRKAEGYENLLYHLYGDLLDAREISLNQKENNKILLVSLKQGKLDNFLIYRYEKGNLIRVSTPDDIPPQSYGILTRGVASFEDIDKDGIKEMIVYSRLSPPEKKREVDVYNILGMEAIKIKTYEEETSKVY
mgnify:FL=1